jgi:hypothetical protein
VNISGPLSASFLLCSFFIIFLRIIRSYEPINHPRRRAIVAGHAGSGDQSGNPELSENRVSQGRLSGALGHHKLQMDSVVRVSENRYKLASEPLGKCRKRTFQGPVGRLSSGRAKRGCRGPAYVRVLGGSLSEARRHFIKSIARFIASIGKLDMPRTVKLLCAWPASTVSMMSCSKPRKRA